MLNSSTNITLIWQRLFPLLKITVVADKVPKQAFYRKYYSKLGTGRKKNPCCLACQSNFHLHCRYKLFTHLQTVPTSLATKNRLYLFHLHIFFKMSSSSLCLFISFLPHFVLRGHQRYLSICRMLCTTTMFILWKSLSTKIHGKMVLVSFPASDPMIPGHSPAHCRCSFYLQLTVCAKILKDKSATSP